MRFLTVAAIVKDEGLYLREWIEFHLLQGVEHFYLTDNDSSDDTLKVLGEYRDRGVVTLLRMSGRCKQMPAYQQMLALGRGLNRWMALIDVDEFLWSPKGDLRTTISTIEEKYSRPRNSASGFVPAIVAHWELFGSSGLKDYDSRLVIERFTYCAAKVDAHVKSIVKPEGVLGFHTVHNCLYKDGQLAIDEKGMRIPERMPYPTPATAEELRIHHYVTKSREECRIRCERGRADILEKRNFEVFFKEHDHNEVFNDSLYRFLPALKERLDHGKPFQIRNPSMQELPAASGFAQADDLGKSRALQFLLSKDSRKRNY